MRYRIEKDRRYGPEFFELMVNTWRPGLVELGWDYYLPTGISRGVYVSNEPDAYWTEWVDVEVFGGLSSNTVNKVVPQWYYEIMDPKIRVKYVTMPKIILPMYCYEEEL